MALIRTDMNCLLSGGAGKVWSYKTTDLRGAVVGAGYFNSMAGVLNVNDRIHCWVGIGGVVEYMAVAVSANTGTTVTVVSSLSMT